MHTLTSSGPSAPTAIRLQAAGPEHEGLLLEVFTESRSEFAMLPPQVRGALVRMQFDAQCAQYRGIPAASQWLVQTSGPAGVTTVGRCWLAPDTDRHRLLDLAIRPAHQGHGFGSAVLALVCERARAAGLPVTLNVWSDNAGAIRLYRRFGFEPDPRQADGPRPAYLRMEWSR